MDVLQRENEIRRHMTTNAEPDSASRPSRKVTPEIRKHDMGPLEKCVVRLDEFPWSALLRVALGYGFVAAWTGPAGNDRADWAIVPAFLGMLMALRIVPVLLRRLLPFSASAKEIWFERRQLAKRFDSYQWQKLLWIGIGMSASQFRLEYRLGTMSGLALVCVCAGAAGLVFFRRAKANGQVPDAFGRSV